MTADLYAPSREPLDPLSRISEILFGLIMVLTFTGSLSVAADEAEVREMLVGALGCNLAWGVIDAIFYLMGVVAERGENLKMFRAVRSAPDSATGRRIVAGALPPVLAQVLTEAELGSIQDRLQALPEPPTKARLSWSDWRAAAGVCALVFFSTFPVAVPFLFMTEPLPALRASNAIAITMLFALGFAFAKMSGRRPIATGLAMVLLGVALVTMTMALGG